MRINNNMMAMNTHRQLGVSTNAGAKSMEKLSSGFRINRAADDAAGLSISEKMRGQIRGLNQASRNAQDGISVVQTAEGALDEVHAMLQRMRELSVQASTDSNTAEDRTYIQEEVNQLLDEISSVSTRTEFNTMKLLDGSFSGKVFHVGANGEQNIKVSIDGVGLATLGINDLKVTGSMMTASGVAEVPPTFDASGVQTNSGTAAVPPQYQDAGVLNQKKADAAIATFDKAIVNVSKQRSSLGAIQNRMEHTIKNLDNAAENLQAAESRVRDVDMAKEMMEQTKQNILQQASTAMLAQAFQSPQSVLQLLR